MNRNVIVIIFVVIIVGGIFSFYAYMKQYAPEFNWAEHYDAENDQPYGLKVFYNLLEQNENKINNLKKDFFEELDTNESNASYIAFGNYLYFDSLRVRHLLSFVNKGNIALIAENSAPLEITKMIVPNTDTIYDYDFYLDSIFDVSYEQSPRKKSLSFHYQYLKDTSQYDWGGYSEIYFNDTLINYGFKPISYVNKKINAYYFDYGKGKVILYSTPILFANYNIIQKNGLDNANTILSYLNSGNIYWDEISQNPINTSFGGGGGPTNNPLMFLFSTYQTRWAWYLFLIAVAMYVLFRTKREQRIIPIMEKNTNSSIAYTKAIGILYFQKGQHKLIANEMYLLFLAQLRGKYNISTSMEEKELVIQASAKSGIDKRVIDQLFKHFRKVRFSPMANSKDLINLHNAVEYYYKNCI